MLDEIHDPLRLHTDMKWLSFKEYIRLRQEGLWINDDLGVEGISKLPKPKPPGKQSSPNGQQKQSTPKPASGKVQTAPKMASRFSPVTATSPTVTAVVRS